MNELENCPCCGGAGEVKDVQGKFRHGWVGCPNCGLYINWAHDPQAAIAKWNRRAGK